MKRGVAYALVSAALFGMSVPLSKTLVGSVSPLLLAGLLYLGAGVGLLVLVAARRAWSPRSISWPRRTDLPWLAGAILVGGILGPVALMHALTVTPASTASLLLNLEAVFTALLAWFLFRENFDRRIAFGMLAIVLGATLLAWAPWESGTTIFGALLIAGACLLWALDNNLTRKASTGDAIVIAGLKGLVAGTVNTSLALLQGHGLPSPWTGSAAALVGFLGYGVSLALFILALRHLGTARAGAYFSVAPFFGAILALAIQGEALTGQLAIAGALMGVGVWLHVTERHGHLHSHEALEHTHSHSHDEHHRHHHGFDWDRREPHVHPHAHEPLMHSHPHYPDVHHRHHH